MSGRPRQGSAADAERRRGALRKALRDADMTPAEAARAADMPTANSLYNYFNRSTNALSTETYQKLARVLPGHTVATLMGDERPHGPVIPLVTVRAEARAGRLRPSYDLPVADQIEMALPIDAKSRVSGVFGVRVCRPGAEQLYAEGTILAVIPVAGFEGSLANKRRVILQRVASEAVEVTVRELEVVKGHAWLWPRSTEARYAQPIEMPWPFSGERMWRKGEERYSILGFVIGSWTPEP